VERRARLFVLIAAGLLVARPSGAAGYSTRADALAIAFPGARLENRSFVLTAAQVRAVERRAQVRVGTKLLSVTLAWRADSLAGTAFFDSRVVRTMPAVFMVTVAPDTTVERIEVLSFHEPPDYRPPARWLTSWGRRGLDDQLWPRLGIRNLSGATLSTRAVTESVRLALALYETVVAPSLARPSAR